MEDKEKQANASEMYETMFFGRMMRLSRDFFNSIMYEKKFLGGIIHDIYIYVYMYIFGGIKKKGNVKVTMSHTAQQAHCEHFFIDLLLQ